MSDALASLGAVEGVIGVAVLDRKHRIALRAAPDWLDAGMLTGIGRRAGEILTAAGGVAASPRDVVLAFTTGTVLVRRLEDALIFVLGEQDVDTAAIRVAADGCERDLAGQNVTALATKAARSASPGATPALPPAATPAAPAPAPKGRKRRRLGVWS